jgi:hypothetical protein
VGLVPNSTDPAPGPDPAGYGRWQDQPLASHRMGLSVSTIRHEAMRIYQAPAVSERKDATKKALTLSLT